VGEIGGHLTIRSIHIKVGVGLVLPKKKDRKNIEKSVKKGKGGKTEKREKQE